MRSPLVVLTLCLSLAPGLKTIAVAADPAPATGPTAASVWLSDFNAAQQKAKQLNRPMVVHFYGNSCPPCRRMEREVLNTAQVLKTLDAGFVAVKICLDNPGNGKVSTKYGIGSMPIDLILSPDGKELARSEGYVGVQQYLANVAKIDARYAAERQRLARSPNEEKTKSAKPEVAQNQTKAAAPANTHPAVTSASPTGDKLVPPATALEPKKIAMVPGPASTPAGPKDENKQPIAAAAGPTIGMDGFCPVTLRSTRTWKPGEKSVSLEHEGQTFYFAAPDLRNEFKAHPERYAPRLLGCDPVVLAERDLVVRGSTKFGAFYDGELFLFESAETRTKFRKDPIRYARLKHVLKPEDVTKIASAGGQ